ncbi:MAG: VWA domain-containing protein, partial [Planctomycetota bacterium]
MNQRTTGEFSFGMRVLSPVGIVAMESPSHPNDFVFARHGENFHEASLETEKGDLSRDIVLTYATSRPKTGVDIITSSPQGEDGYFMATLTAGDELEHSSEAMDYVFILDISGSMQHGQKLGLSRKSIDAFVKNLAPEDRFELIAFNLQPLKLFGELRQADESAMTEATGFLNSQEAKGGTVLAPAMQTAYHYGEPDRHLNVIILSDGMTEQKERGELIRLIRQRPENATVFAIGVGNDVDRPLLTQLAENAGGLADFISTEDNFQRQSEAFRRKLTRPAATNVKIDIDGVDAYSIVPAEIPNLYHGMPVHVFGRFRKGNEFRVTTSFEVNGRPMQATTSQERSPRNNPEIERMWAWNLVQQFQNSMRQSGEDQATIDQIVDLGEMYSIVTPYTSFLVLENNDEYRRWKIERRNDKRLTRDRRNQEQLAEQLNQLRDKALADLGPKRNARPGPNQTAHSQPSNPQLQPSTTTYNTPEPSSRLLMLIGMMVLILRRLRT